MSLSGRRKHRRSNLFCLKATLGRYFVHSADLSRDTAIQMMLMTGARCSEVCDAVWGEFDLDRGVWVLPGRRRRPQSLGG